MSCLMPAHDLDDPSKVRTADVGTKGDADFRSLYLSEPVLKGLSAAGFKRPSPIQQQAIPLGNCGFDMIVQAKSGTGKTCVFAVIALEKLKVDYPYTQVIVIAPAREIAVQVTQVISAVGSGIKGLKVSHFIGGLPLSEDKANLQGCHVAVGTPGRMAHLIGSNLLKTNDVTLVVLDEADKLMDKNYKMAMSKIFARLPVPRQVLCLSATYPADLAEMMSKCLRSPLHVRLDQQKLTLLGIYHYLVLVKNHPLVEQLYQRKIVRLMALVEKEVGFSQCLIFCNSQLRAERVSKHLKNEGWPAELLSASMEQVERLAALESARTLGCRILVSTDLGARGLDFEGANMVVNFDPPVDGATFLHRVGRAGRFGGEGMAFFLAGEGDRGEEGKVRQMANDVRVEWEQVIEVGEKMGKGKRMIKNVVGAGNNNNDDAAAGEIENEQKAVEGVSNGGKVKSTAKNEPLGDEAVRSESIEKSKSVVNGSNREEICYERNGNVEVRNMKTEDQIVKSEAGKFQGADAPEIDKPCTENGVRGIGIVASETIDIGKKVLESGVVADDKNVACGKGIFDRTQGMCRIEDIGKAVDDGESVTNDDNMEKAPVCDDVLSELFPDLSVGEVPGAEHMCSLSSYSELLDEFESFSSNSSREPEFFEIQLTPTDIVENLIGRMGKEFSQLLQGVELSCKLQGVEKVLKQITGEEKEEKQDLFKVDPKSDLAQKWATPGEVRKQRRSKPVKRRVRSKAQDYESDLTSSESSSDSDSDITDSEDESSNQELQHYNNYWCQEWFRQLAVNRDWIEYNEYWRAMNTH